jgi:DNA repair exonuclease SbcCD ATPase subunit
MTEEEYERMERLQSEAKKGIKKLAEAEDYQKKIKNDLKRLDGEHQAYVYREEELVNTMDNCRKLIIVVAVTLALIIVLLMVLNKVLNLNVAYGYMISVLMAAVALTYLFIHNSNAELELKGVNKSISRLIMLQNQVKIRYVNNTNLIDYLCLKFRVNNARELKALYEKYLQEVKEREAYEDAQKNLDVNQKDLVYMLKRLRIKDPEIWVHQVEALLSHNEEVEIRHSLNVQRQSLRRRMEYNRDVVAGNAKREIEDMAQQYPEYTQEILDMVSRYEEKYPSF